MTMQKSEDFFSCHRKMNRTDLDRFHWKNAILPRIQDFQDGCRNAEADFMPFHLTDRPTSEEIPYLEY